MIEIPFMTFEIGFAVLWLALRAALWITRRKIDWKREAMLLLMYINLAIILRFTFFPMALLNGRIQPLLFDATAVFPFRINLRPLVYLFNFDSRRDILLNVVGNAVMFIPSGILLPILYRRLDSFWKVLAAGAGISLCIEILQLPFSVRASDVDDLLMNSLGVIVGYGIYALVRALRRRA